MSYLAILIFLLTPAYAVRFLLGSQPVNLLLVAVFAVWALAAALLLYKKQARNFFAFAKSLPTPLLVLVGLFFISGTLALLTEGITAKKIAQWVVLFVQPVGTFFLAAYAFHAEPSKKQSFTFFMYCLLGLLGLLALYQYATLEFLPLRYWGNSVEPKRAVALFSHPNFYALFIAPLLAFLLPDLLEKIKTKNLSFAAENVICKIGYALGFVGLLLSMSRAGWLGFAAAAGIFVLIAGDKKIRKLALALAVVLAMAVVAIPNLRYRVLLPFMGEKSAVSRFSLWHTGVKALQEHPLTGLGLTGFSQNWTRLNTDPNLDSHNFPHNVFLNFWVETGLLGLLAFLGLCAFIMYQGFKNKTNPYALGIALFLITLILQGLIDNPYFKNDLAMVFWLVMALNSSK